MSSKEIIMFENREIEYELRVSKRARNIRLEINHRGELFLVKPHYVSLRVAQDFLIERRDWVLNNLEKRYSDLKILDLNKKDYKKHKELARQILTQKVEFFCHFYGVKYSKICIRNPKTRWGSCSVDGNLNFSFKLIFLPDYLVDYVVVHEICHLIELNHSNRFWAQVEKQIPDYREARKELRKYV